MSCQRAGWLVDVQIAGLGGGWGEMGGKEKTGRGEDEKRMIRIHFRHSSFISTVGPSKLMDPYLISGFGSMGWQVIPC